MLVFYKIIPKTEMTALAQENVSESGSHFTLLLLTSQKLCQVYDFVISRSADDDDGNGGIQGPNDGDDDADDDDLTT